MNSCYLGEMNSFLLALVLRNKTRHLSVQTNRIRSHCCTVCVCHSKGRSCRIKSHLELGRTGGTISIDMG